MAPLVLFLIPLAGALAAYLIPSSPFSRYWRPYLIPLVSGSQLVVSFYCGAHYQGQAFLGGTVVFDPLACLFLIGIGCLFFPCALYAPAYLHHRRDRPNRIFCTSLLALLGVTPLVYISHHLGLMWVAIEATTLASAPLIYFNRRALSLEAVWKYLIICSVGIALALLGTFFLAYGAIAPGSQHLTPSLFFDSLLTTAPMLSKPWLHAAFITLLVGYGTKMGLAPLHTWKPDAYGEAPGIAGALLAGGVTSAAFMAIIRVSMIMRAAGEFPYAARYLIGCGLFSMLVASLFLVGQRDFKRMLAYSSVEHMGILVLGLGVGGLGTFAALFHTINNALTKGILFLSAGNLHRVYGGKNVEQVQGATKIVPRTSVLFLIGFFAITGSPPFSPFASLFSLVCALFDSKAYLIMLAVLALLFMAFLGMGKTVLSVVQGIPPEAILKSRKSKRSAEILGPILILLCLVLVLGIVPPEAVMQAIERATSYVELR